MLVVLGLCLVLNFKVLLLLVCLCELGVDNSQGQVQKEESSNEHQGQEVAKDPRRERLLHLSLDITPSFQCDRLENTQERIAHIVKVGDTIVGVLVGLAAEVATWALVIVSAQNLVSMDLSVLD